MADFKDKRTIIGPTISIRGKLRSDEDLVIRGRIDAAIASTKLVHVDTDGVVKATIEAESVVVSGVVVGNISAGSRAELLGSARIVGDLSTPLMVINDGARLRGKIDMPGVDKAMTEPYVERAPAPQPAPKPQPVAAATPSPAAAPGTPLPIAAAKSEPIREPGAPSAPLPNMPTPPAFQAAKTEPQAVPPLKVSAPIKPITAEPRDMKVPGLQPGKPLPGVPAAAATPEPMAPFEMEELSDGLGEPEVEEVELGDDQDMMALFDPDQGEPTNVSNIPAGIAAKSRRPS